MSFNTSGSLNALSSSPDGKNVVVAGREVLKILQIDDDGIQQVLNLRAGYHVASNTNYSSNDVKWAGAYAKNTIVTAASSGAILVWDINKSTADKLDRIIIEHSRSVNKICFHPTEISLLLSASQDGTMKLWDLRTKNQSRFTIRGKAESARDVQFNPTGTHEFIAAFENGSVQKWDIRNPSTMERLWNAHSGLALSVDWHADGVLFASGGRDKTIKVWDSKSEGKKPVNVVSTIAPISVVQWRPGYTSQIAACSLSFDSRIHVWDTKRPFVAKYCLNEHTNDTTGIYWLGKDTLWSCSKDSTFSQHDLCDSYQPKSLLNNCAMGWSLGGNICFAINVKDSDNFASLKWRKNAPQQLSGIHDTEAFDSDAFLRFASCYMRDSNISRVCEHNAAIAYDFGCYITAKCWKIINLFYGEKKIEPKNLTKDFGVLPEAVYQPEDIDSDEEKENMVVEPAILGWRLDDDSSSDDSDPDLLGLRPLKQISTFDLNVLVQPKHTGKQKKTKDVIIPIWEGEAVIKQILEYFAEEGNVQMCFSISRLLPDLKIQQDTLRQWAISYIDLLRKHKQWIIATELMNETQLKDVQGLNQEAASIYTGCGTCKDNCYYLNAPWGCEKCRKPTSVCSIW